MAAVFRVGVVRLINGSKASKLLSNTPELKIPFRGIAGKDLRIRLNTPPRPAPWPYKTKSYTLLNYFFDRTTGRFDANTKLIVVEGPVAAGKTKFAKQLAEDLDMLYLPEANQDMYYTNPYGYNLKQMNEQLPESCQAFDIKDFLANPRHMNTANFQIRQYMVKFSQYIDALAHILSTGQGVILDRCAYSDFVFLEAMYKQGYISKGARSVYYDIRKNTICELLRPHLVIYLHVPVPKVLENIKKRNIQAEMNSTVLTANYLQFIEDKYKQGYLKTISEHSELLVYDWSEEAEVEVVVEDVERISFGEYDKQDHKMKDWEHFLEEDWAILRHKYADKKQDLLYYVNVPRLDVPELLVDADDAQICRDVMTSAPGMKYDTGFNSSMGDTGVFLNMGGKPNYTLPLIERRLD